MALTSGTKLGPYEIQSPLGAGGMGEVYRATDVRLKRDVAVKVLRPEIAADPERRARFEREAKTVAALSHPNIVALYEVGNADGLEYTVSELVDGQSLRAQIIGQGAIPVRQVVELATQLAEGMAAAHAAGIVHRDLKPENVMVTRDGRVKVLDFGLARVLPVTSRPAQGSTSATMDSLPVVERPGPAEYMTKPGMVLGTFAYMSPEQARGQDADYRSDQFSFGLIVYEMLSGRQAFVCDSAVETMAAIVRDEAEPLKTKMPMPLKWLVERCLEKEPTRRFDSSRDLYQQLRTLRDHLSEAFRGSMQAALPEKAAAQAGAQRRGFGIRATLALAALTVAGGAPVRLVGAADTSQVQVPGDWSPDGKQFAFASIEPDGTLPLKIVRTSGGAVAQKLDGTSNDGMISWSPDGRWIAYPDENSVWHLVSPDGKQHRDLGAIRSESLAFSKDGRRAYGIRQDAGKWFLFSLDIETGKLHDIKGLDSSLRPQAELHPAIRFTLAPDGKSFAYSVVKSESSVWMLHGFANK